MKFSFYKQEVLSPLNKVIGAIEKKHATLPVLANVLISIKDKRIEMLGTDLELELKSVGEIQSSEDEGKITVPARVLLDIVKAMPEKELIIAKKEENKLLIKCNKSTFKVATIDADSFPNNEAVDEQTSFQVSAKALKELLLSTNFSMAQQDIRYFLNGMLFEFYKGNIRAVATDGHRLATNVVEVPLELDNILKIIIPKKAVQEILKLISDEEGEVRLAVGEGIFRVITKSCEISSRTVEGKFPNYERVIPREEGRKVLIEKKKLLEALQRSIAIASDRTKSANFVFSKNKITIVATNAEGDEAREEVDVEYDGKEVSIGFNVVYLIEFMQFIKQDTIVMKISEPTSSVVVVPAEETSLTYVVMPMRL